VWIPPPSCWSRFRPQPASGDRRPSHCHGLWRRPPCCFVLRRRTHVIRRRCPFSRPPVRSRAAPPPKAASWITFRIVPTAPETGYGLHRGGRAVCQPVANSRHPAAGCDRPALLENPMPPRPSSSSPTGRFTWNAACSVRASATWLSLLRLSPELVSMPRRPRSRQRASRVSAAGARRPFPRCAKRGDRCGGDLERNPLGSVLPLEAGWERCGQLESALGKTADQDSRRATVCGGGVISEGSRNCYLRSEHRWWWASASYDLWW